MIGQLWAKAFPCLFMFAFCFHGTGNNSSLLSKAYLMPLLHLFSFYNHAFSTILTLLVKLLSLFHCFFFFGDPRCPYQCFLNDIFTFVNIVGKI
jgi:hypothetical protein